MPKTVVAAVVVAAGVVPLLLVAAGIKLGLWGAISDDNEVRALRLAVATWIVLVAFCVGRLAKSRSKS